MNALSPDPEGAAALVCHDEERPQHIIATESTQSDATVHPGDVAEWVRSASMQDQFRLLDPLAIRGWPRCPRCRHRSIEIADVVGAWCARCGAEWTRWSIGRRVLSSQRACRRIAAQILFDREAVA